MTYCFIDSNIIVYANDRNSGAKQDRAIETVELLMRNQRGVISTQVLQEYAHVALNKLGQDSGIVIRQLKLLERLVMSPITCRTTRRAVELLCAYGISFWDANIVAAAEQAGCDLVLSEDLNAGQLYAGLKVLNPFDGEQFLSWRRTMAQ